VIAKGGANGGYTAGVGGAGGHPKTGVGIVGADEEGDDGEPQPKDASATRMTLATIAIRVCPRLPPTTEERIADSRAQSFADSVMYREALATAAEARGWSVHCVHCLCNRRHP